VRTLRRDDVQLSEFDRAQFLEMIESEATRLAKIVDQILLAGQLDADAVELELTECDPAEIAAGVIESAETHLPASISLSLDADGSPQIACDPNKLRQVLVNLVDNAVKYSPKGGEVILRVRSDNGSCQIDVSDEGLGIPAGEQARIFEKFYRLDPQQTQGVGGSGLGLYICRELVERMDGRLTVESEPGRGSRFSVVLPASA
jgi:signal transduction histidine kinase